MAPPHILENHESKEVKENLPVYKTDNLKIQQIVPGNREQSI